MLKHARGIRMKRNGNGKKMAAAGLALILACSMLPVRSLEAAPDSAEAQEEEQPEEKPQETVMIETAEEFAEFASQCGLDSWSADKWVILQQDIDLTGTDVQMIPIFAGVFDGNNHTISGFRCEGDGYAGGLFRYITQSGTVKNLKLQGKVEGTEEQECIGSICGVNYGVIQNCDFTGTVKSQDTVGGIAGINGASGTITDCDVYGHVAGYYTTGGIVGANHGSMARCHNHSGINDDSEWVEKDDEMETGLFSGISSSDGEVDFYSGVDTGGIAGYSDGTITSCTNDGTVGYEHTGYNIGGIAGRQAGVMSHCRNTGNVFGRKDVGGIVGQMEPYIEVDEAESLRNAVNKLHDLIDGTLDHLQSGKNTVQSDVDRITAYGDEALDTGHGMADQVSNFADTNVQQIHEINARLDYVTDQLPGVTSGIASAGDSFQQFEEEMEKALRNATVSGGDLEMDTGTAMERLKSMAASLQNAAQQTKNIADYLKEQPDITFSTLGGEFNDSRNALYGQVKGMTDGLKDLNRNASSYSDQTGTDLKAVNDQMNVVFNLLADNLSGKGFSVEEMYEEVSDDEIDFITTGRADFCTNEGVVRGDINIGGIAGSMAIDEEDPEGNAAGNIDYEMGRRFIMKCVIESGVNKGFVTAKKDGAGGIAGYMGHGIVTDSEAYGSVESTEGDYVGGICGESLTVIRNSYALCDVSGGSNVGGIAGYANTLQNCYAIVNVEASSDRKGAIAGQVADLQMAGADGELNVYGNYYVDDILCGIDGVSYAGVAEPISYQELLAREDVPRDFRHLKVFYRVEDNSLGYEEVKFGQSLSGLHYPQMPEREGYYGVWPDYSDQVMSGNLVIRGEYHENVPVVESSEKSSGQTDYELPYALVEQKFTEDTRLSVHIGDAEPPEDAGKEYVIYDISLENSPLPEEEMFPVRLLNPYENAQVWGLSDGTWEKLESKARGRYLQVDMTGTGELFCIAAVGGGVPLPAVGAAAGGALVLVSFLGLRKRAKKKRAEKKQEAAE